MVNKKGEETGIIYGWYNTLTDMWYVGQTIHPLSRFKRHIDWAINKKDNNKFHNALRKYGLKNWVYCVLEENILRENLNMKEMDWIEEFDSFYDGYNMSAGGGQNTKFSEETRRKLSESCKGKNFFGEKNPFYGRHHTEESKRKISEARKRRPSILKGLPGLKGPKNGMYGKPAPNRKKVIKYDLNGNFIKNYDCITHAIKENPKCRAISAVCRGELNQTGGFIWKYAS